MNPAPPWDEDRGRGGGVAGDWRTTHPRFDDPMSWSLPVCQIAGVTVRVHVLFLVVIVTWLLKSLVTDPSGGAATPFDLMRTALALGALFLIVLAHEFGHVAACRSVGGDADEILLWPLGGLAFCDPPRHWKADLITTLGGPLVNLALWTCAALILGLGVGWRLSVIAPDPFNPVAFASMPGRLFEAIFIVHWVNWILLLFNLLPIFPLDGGRILMALLARRMEFDAATRISSRVGVVGAVCMLVVAVVVESWMLAAVALFGGITCLISLRRIEAASALEQGLGDPSAARERRMAERRAERLADLEARRHEARERDRARLDQILAKIGREGRGSLTWAERRFLKRATRRLRDE